MNSNSTKEEWNAIIASKLKEGISLDNLKHEYAPGIVVEPNVLNTDIADYHHKVEVTRTWTNMAMIDSGNSNHKNTLALQALQQGANGLSILISPDDTVSDILNDIMTEYLDVRLDCTSLSSSEIQKQQSTINENEYPNLRWISNNGHHAQFFITKNKRVSSIQDVLNNIEQTQQADVIVDLSKNLLFEIASLRAIRSLLGESGMESFQIIAQYDVDGTNELGDYNLIEKTYKVMSGIMGGADAIFTPYQDDEESRLTLNMHNVLDLESGMKNVLDPLHGSYYIEKLTGEIIRQVKEES